LGERSLPGRDATVFAHNPFILHFNPPPGLRQILGVPNVAVKGEGKLNARVPFAFVELVAGLLVLGFLPRLIVTYGGSIALSVAASVALAVPLIVQGPFALALPIQKAALLKFLERCGPETEILKSKAVTLMSYDIEVKAVVGGAEHRFFVGFRPFGLRTSSHFLMVWPTTRKGISYQNQVRFNNFSRKFNTMEFTYLRNWHVRLFTYPMAQDTWWFDLYLFKGLKATADHMWECYQIALETKDKLTRPNPAF